CAGSQRRWRGGDLSVTALVRFLRYSCAAAASAVTGLLGMRADGGDGVPGCRLERVPHPLVMLVVSAADEARVREASHYAAARLVAIRSTSSPTTGPICSSATRPTSYRATLSR